MTFIRGKNHGRTIPYSASSHSEGAELFIPASGAQSFDGEIWNFSLLPSLTDDIVDFTAEA